MEGYDYFNPVRLIYGPGSVNRVGELVAEHGTRVLLVYGRAHLKETGAYERVTSSLRNAGVTWVELSGVQPNPDVTLVRKGVELCRSQPIDFVLGVGGGSTSDTVKAVAFAAQADYDPWLAYEDFHNLMHGNNGDFRHVPQAVLPFGVVMTKPGTGSEFDYTSVLSNRDTGEKLMVINKQLYATFAVHDPELTFTLPRQERAYGIADIMTHYLEQYFSSSRDTDVLDEMKEAGLRTVISAARRVMEDPSDVAAQSQLLYCAAWACSDQSMTGIAGEWAAHMIEHELTARTNVNHGHGMAVVYPAWMKSVLERIPEKFARFATRVWGVSPDGRGAREVGLEGIRRTEEFWRSLGITLSLRGTGATLQDIPELARRAVRFGAIGNVRSLAEADVREVLERALA